MLLAFDQPIPQSILDISKKNRSNLFTWRGQFSPQLIEAILKYYCLPNSVILDPFWGSGTVLLEGGRLGLNGYGFEINPAAYCLSKVYELINLFSQKESIKTVKILIDQEFPFRIFESHLLSKDLVARLVTIKKKLDPQALLIFEALVILLDVGNNDITNEFIQDRFYHLTKIINNFPYSQSPIKVKLSDARYLPLKENQIDFVVTSPPYINVFNYHQNYRKSAELLGWNILKIAKSEIGSNRANRGNRFYTVVQYCLDMSAFLKELGRVTKKNARILLIVGHKSQVLGVPFYNADIIESIAIKSNLFYKVLRQKREFKNQFGKMIREDLIHLVNSKPENLKQENIDNIAREVAFAALEKSLSIVSSNNKTLLDSAMVKCHSITGTLILDFSLFNLSNDTICV